MEIITKEDAIQKGQKWYFSGIPCKNGHLDKRYVNTGICYACKRKQNRDSNRRNDERFKKSTKINYQRHKKAINGRSRIWSENNRQKSNEIKYNWKIRHREKYLIQARKYAKEKRKNPYYKLSKNMSKAIWDCLKNNKNNTTWLEFVDFSIDELILHLESGFTAEMTWENYGIFWHIDHIKPLSWFDLETEFKDAWALSNLQPLEGKINMSKGNKYIG